MHNPGFIPVLIHSAITLYMMAVLLRWTAPWLEVNVHQGRLAWIPRLTDPLLLRVRHILPPTGGMLDWSPIATLMGLWILRVLLAGS
ncbi:MAG: YggT family protein [Candidatus Hydrogenedentes bacterium]|nr:YggT family protein [Candidatus Hydrogenedentota bacterium]